MQEMFPNNIVDLSLRVRQTRTDLERRQKETINRVDEFCMEYERSIREMGGIGFFLGGIGPDGHIAFNVCGSSVYSVTRLTGTNYETQAAAATDLGGIEVSRSRLVITIGLATITYNPTATAIIIAAGDAKAPIVAAGDREETESAVSGIGAAGARGRPDVSDQRRGQPSGGTTLRGLPQQDRNPADADIDDVVVPLALEHYGKRVTELQTEDLAQPTGSAQSCLQKSGQPVHDAGAAVSRSGCMTKIERGLAPVTETVFLHTEPHHDDIMLGYLAHIYHLVRDPSNKHYFANLTSGFTAVSNPFCHSIVQNLQPYLEYGEVPADAEGRLLQSEEPGQQDGRRLPVSGRRRGEQCGKKGEGEARRMLRNLIEVYNTSDMRVLRLRVKELDEYFADAVPRSQGSAGYPDVQGDHPRMGGGAALGLLRASTPRRFPPSVWDSTKATSSRKSRKWTAM